MRQCNDVVILWAFSVVGDPSPGLAMDHRTTRQLRRCNYDVCIVDAWQHLGDYGDGLWWWSYTYVCTSLYIYIYLYVHDGVMGMVRWSVDSHVGFVMDRSNGRWLLIGKQKLHGCVFIRLMLPWRRDDGLIAPTIGVWLDGVPTVGFSNRPYNQTSTTVG